MSLETKETQVIQWIFDTRRAWLEANKTADLIHVAQSSLNLLPQPERDEVLRYFRVRDAKMALASRLLKRYAISRFCQVAWDEATPTRDANKKPIFINKDGSEPFIFNVTHQNGLVLLLGVYQPPKGLAVGIDLVSPSERKDHDVKNITQEGWSGFVDMHAEVFSPHEVTALNRLPYDQRSDDGRTSLLRYFYALWCLREAYVKMTGEALLASWLRDVEMRGFAPPGSSGRTLEGVWFFGKKVEGVEVRLENLLDGFMVASVVREGENGASVKLGEYEDLALDVILAYAGGA